MSRLFSAVKIGNLALQNRIAIAPMCQYSADNGNAGDWHLMHYGQLAMSGAGLLIIEATAVEPEGRISPNDLGLWSDENQAALERVVKGVRGYSSMPLGIQLAHAGRKGSTMRPWDGGIFISSARDSGWRTLAPSNLPFQSDDGIPLPLDAEGISRVTANFAGSATRAAAIGLDFIEVHIAHGYLLHQFLSPLSNVRADNYGGSLENRMRFPLEVFEAVRKAFPADKPVGVRISATDWVRGGWNLEQSVIFAAELQRRNCSFIDVSSGGLSPEQQIPIGPSYQVPFAARIKYELAKEFGVEKAMPVISVGLITEPEQAEAIIGTGQADMVALARGMLYNPRWPWHAAAKLGAQVVAPPQYWRSQPHNLKNLFDATGN